MKIRHQLLIGFLLLSVCILAGCTEEEYYMCNSCGDPVINVTDIRVYNCTSRTEGQAGYDYVTNDYYYCNESTWVKLNNQTGGGIINITNNITNNIMNNYTTIYNDTAINNSIATLNTTKLNITDQRYNETTFIQTNYNTITQDALSDFNMWGCYRNGTYCDGLTGQSAHTTATAFSASVLRCFPFITGRGFKIDQLGFIVATANNSNGVKLALYSDNGFGYPNALLVNTSSLNQSGTGLLVQTITAYQLQNNSLYWLCSATNNSGTTMRVNTAPLSDYPQLLGITSGTASNIGYTVAYTYTNAFPNPYTAGATYLTAIYPTGFVRVRTDI